MRKFHVLAVDPTRYDLQSIVAADLGNFDRTPLRRGERMGDFPEAMRVYLSARKRTDMLGNAWGWKIMSERAVKLILDFVPADDLQIKPLPLYDFVTKDPVLGYSLVNSLRLISALAYPRSSGQLYMNQVTLKQSLIPPGTHLFRLGEEPRHWIISEQLWQGLSELQGVDAVEVQTVT